MRQLKPETKDKLAKNIKRLSFFLDMDGTLCAAGQDLKEAKALLNAMVQTFDGAVCINTAQSVQYLSRAGGDCVPCRSTELGLTIVLKDNTYVFDKPPEFATVLKYVRTWIETHPSAIFYIIEKNGGFAVKFTDEDGRLARGADVDAVVALMRSLVKDRDDLIVVVTDGFADVCSSVLSKGYALQKIAVRAPLIGQFVVAAGDGLTDEAMFEFADVGRP
jgi:trehalose-6-phosphatase